MKAKLMDILTVLFVNLSVLLTAVPLCVWHKAKNCGNMFIMVHVGNSIYLQGHKRHVRYLIYFMIWCNFSKIYKILDCSKFSKWSEFVVGDMCARRLVTVEYLFSVRFYSIADAQRAIVFILWLILQSFIYGEHLLVHTTTTWNLIP